MTVVAEDNGFVGAERFGDFGAFFGFEGDAAVVEADGVVVVEALWS